MEGDLHISAGSADLNDICQHAEYLALVLILVFT